MGDCENTTNLSQGHLTSFVLLYSQLVHIVDNNWRSFKFKPLVK